MDSKGKISGEQLRMARLAHGLSLEELGERVSATRQFIHQLETGARSPSGEMTEALADVLGVRIEFLALTLPSTVRPEQCHFRGHVARPASITSQVLARGTILDSMVAVLEREVDLPTVNFPDIAVGSAEDIERAAEETRRYWGLGNAGPITSMMRVVENAGAIVTYFGDLSDRVDAFSMDRARPVIVRSSLKGSACRQRFDLAHECGHLIMHRGIQTGDKATEDQAHRFASAFLFPRAAALRELPRGRSIHWQKLYELKLRWKISVRALVRRSYDLGIFTPAQYRTANIHLMKTGQAKAERYDDHPSLEVEQPELLPAALNVLEHEGRGVRELIAQAGLADATFERVTGLPAPPPRLSNVAWNVVPIR
jgi:Zn-dependent peptidase ImmA (M78 family)/transcriptional regulator with XRE-family HTH domain